MHDFVSHVLRRYWEVTGWNSHNSYLHLTSTSNAVLDFNIPTGLSFSISASPSPPFFTTYRLRALPTLSGALGYIFASTDPEAPPLDIGSSSRDVRFKDIVERFRVIEAPKRPIGKEEVFQGGRRVDTRDYLIYGCMHVPSARVDALCATRLSPTWQLLVTAISVPPRPPSHMADRSASGYDASGGLSTSSGNLSTQASAPTPSAPPPGATNLQINLQRDTGRWFTEYSYSADDALWGFRVLHNFGTPDTVAPITSTSTDGSESLGQAGDAAMAKMEQRVDEESGLEAVAGGGLQGRFSFGAEMFFSAAEKSAGLSTGVRFTTLPDLPSFGGANSTTAGSTTGANYSDSPPSQPPTTITATLNPMMGHLSTAYAARMTRDIVACSRFDFNVYSYDSELTLGTEYWLRKSTSKEDTSKSFPPWRAIPLQEDEKEEERSHTSSGPSTLTPKERELEGTLTKEAEKGLSLRESGHLPPPPTSTSPTSWSLREEFPIFSDPSLSKQEPDQEAGSSFDATSNTSSLIQRPSSAVGVLKARLSTSGIIALLWEGRLRNCLVSFGVKADLSPNQYGESSEKGSGSSTLNAAASAAAGGRPLRAVGLDVLYFSQSRKG